MPNLPKSQQWQTTKTAADVAGIVDPTPTSDGVSLGMSVAEGDWLGAFLSSVSFVPYLGDAVAKPAKIARTTENIATIEKKSSRVGEDN